jgi:hypothetical protein
MLGGVVVAVLVGASRVVVSSSRAAGDELLEHAATVTRHAASALAHRILAVALERDDRVVIGAM